MKRILVIGRFQPPHKGHLEVLERAARRCDQLLVVIGSAHDSYSTTNPFTAGERVEMLDAALKARGVENALLVPLADLNRPAEWVAYLASFVPPFDEVVTNNPLTKMLFEAADYKVRTERMFTPARFSGTRIRERLRRGEPIHDAVDEAVLSILQRIGAQRRIQELTGAKPRAKTRRTR